MGKNKKNKSSKAKSGTLKVQDKGNNNARDSDARREALRRRLQMKHRERNMDTESPESVLALALSYANCGKVAKACEAFGMVPAELLNPHRERYACLLIDNEQADLARVQIDQSHNASEPCRTANLYTRALIEYIASHHLEESTKEEAENALRDAFAHNPFVAEAIAWNSFDKLLADDSVLEQMPDAEKLVPEEVAISYLICWGQLELWQDSTANEWLLEQLWGSEELPTMPVPTGCLRQRWITARSEALEEWMEAQSE